MLRAQQINDQRETNTCQKRRAKETQKQVNKIHLCLEKSNTKTCKYSKETPPEKHENRQIKDICTWKNVDTGVYSFEIYV